MKYSEIINLVTSSHHNDWLTTRKDDVEYKIHAEEVNIRFEYSLQHLIEPCFNETWLTQKLRCPQAEVYKHFLYYNQSPVKEVLLIHANNSRIILPLPDTHQNIISSRLDYRIASLFYTTEEILNNYLKQSDLKIDFY